MTQPHYTADDYEPIKIIEHYDLGFHLGNVIKYVLRAGKKDGEPTVKDLKKAQWYIEREIAKIELANNEGYF